MGVTVIVPVRAGSERVRGKNTVPFDREGHSLLEVKLLQLRQLEGVERILVSTNDEEAIRQSSAAGISHLSIDVRPNHLCESSTILQDLMRYFAEVIDTSYFLWTHVTSPFISAEVYAEALDSFFGRNPPNPDGLVSVHSYRDFFYFQGSPLNFGHQGNYWPRTQDLEPLYRVTSGIFLGGIHLLQSGNRVGRNPDFFEVSSRQAIDIDWPQDFREARSLFLSEADSEDVEMFK